MDAEEVLTEQREMELHYWRIDRFRALGYKRHQAEILELAHVDWHELKLLLDQNCPREVALEILT